MQAVRSGAARLLRKYPVYLNSPFIVAMFLLCLFTMCLHSLGFSVLRHCMLLPYRAMPSLWSLHRLALYPLAHSSWEHFSNNFAVLLLLVPPIEDEFGTRHVAFVTLCSVLVTGLTVSVLSSYGLVGASGVVFTFIFLHSGRSVGLAKQANSPSAGPKPIPLTFILLVGYYTLREVVLMFSADGVSHTAHLLGGAVGALIALHSERQRGGHAQQPPASDTTWL